MAINNIEIELKIPVNEATFALVKERLTGLAEFMEKTTQRDDYYTPAHRNFIVPEYPYEYLSVRRRGDKAFLNYKHQYPENSATFTHRDELETEIDEPEKLEAILADLNFQKIVTIEKTRILYRALGEFEIALDYVKNLGLYVEIEAIKDFGTVENALSNIKEFAGFLGLDPEHAELRGYAHMLMEKAGKLKK